MAKKELKYQKELVDVAKKFGGYGLKMNNRFIGGIPDLLLKLLDWHDVFFIEVKHEDYKRVPGTVKVNLTSLQRAELTKMQRAGMQAGWVIFVTENGKDPIILHGNDPGQKEVTIQEDNFFVWDKKVGTLNGIMACLYVKRD